MPHYNKRRQKVTAKRSGFFTRSKQTDKHQSCNQSVAKIADGGEDDEMQPDLKECSIEEHSKNKLTKQHGMQRIETFANNVMQNDNNNDNKSNISKDGNEKKL